MRAPSVLDDRFEVEGGPSSGGMGSVYRALDRVTGEAVAVKVLHVRGEREEARFLREAAALAELRHPAVVRYVAHGAAPGTGPYLVMEWIEGEDLAHRLATQGLSLAETVALGVRVAEALGAAHARGIVHRDIKPGNVMLPGGRIEALKVVDFGVARVGGQALTRTGALVGTPAYMAPEQARGAREIDARADVFALGCVLFECLAGTTPFTGDNVMAILAKVLFDDAPRVTTLRPELPPAMDDLVAGLLSRDPAGRPRDGAAVAQALGALRDLGSAPALRSTARRGPALTAREQRLICMVMAPAEELALGAGTSTDGHAATLAEEGTVLERLADGSRVALVAGVGGNAGDQATRAARLALTLATARPSVPVAVVTGYAELGCAVPVSDVVDRAAGMLREPGGGVRVDEATAGLLAGRFVLREGACGRELCGEVAGVEAVPTVLGRPWPFLGRERELRGLRDLYDECVGDGVARAALLVAAPGAGKSRLAREFLAELRAREDPPELWSGRGDVLAQGAAFAVLGSALRRAAGVHEGDSEAVRRAGIEARFAQRVPARERARVVGFVGAIAGVELRDAEYEALGGHRGNAQWMADQQRRAWEDLVWHETAARPLVLVVEDLQWGDAASVRFLDAALRKARERAFFVLALGRPELRERFPGLWSERAVHELRLGALGKRAQEALVAAALGEGFAGAARLVERAEGNPFYLEELCRSVARSGEERLPDTVLATVQARLSAFDPEARRVLRAASVFGEAAWGGGILRLLGGGAEAESRAWLEALVEGEVLEHREGSRFPGEEAYGFRHGLLREAAYTTLLGEDRALGHRLAAEWLEEKGETDALLLAGHWDRGGHPARAARWYLRAAEQALAANDLEGAAARAEEGVRRDASGEHLVDLWVVQAEALAWRGDCAQGGEVAAEVMALADPGSLPWCRAAVVRLMAAAELGQVDVFVEVLGAYGGAEPAEDAREAFLVGMGSLALACFFGGLAPMGLGLMERMEALAGSDLRGRAMVLKARAWRAFWAEGDPWTALGLSRAAARMFDEAGDARTAAFTGMDVANMAWALGQWAPCEEEARRVLATGEELGLGLTVDTARVWRAFALAALGRAQEGEREARRVAGDAEARGSKVAEGLARWALAEALEARGAWEEAYEASARAAELLVMSPGNRAGVLATGAALRLRTGQVQEALALAREAVEGIEATGCVVPHREVALYRVYARALAAAGELERAREAQARAEAALARRAARIDDAAARAAYRAYEAG